MYDDVIDPYQQTVDSDQKGIRAMLQRLERQERAKRQREERTQVAKAA